MDVLTLLKQLFPDAAEGVAGGARFGAAGMDSLGVVEFLLALQREFGIPVDGDELTVDSTVDDAVELLRVHGRPAG